MEGRVESVLLSTYFIPQALPSGGAGRGSRSMLQVYGKWPMHVHSSDLFLTASQPIVDQIRTNLAATRYTNWAGCSRTQDATPPLPCRTSAAPVHCVSGARRCGTLEENSRDPFAEFGVEDIPTGYALFTVDFVLDEDPNRGSLLFRGFYEKSGSGYEVALFDGGHNPLAVSCRPLKEQSSASYATGLRYVQHRCARATATDQTLAELSRARFVRITLPGEFRQFWVQRVRIKFRKFADLAPSPPPSPLPPPLALAGKTAPDAPPPPAAPPDAPRAPECHQYKNLMWSTTQYTVLAEEPCGLSHEQCCAIATSNGVAAYTLSESGCCSLVNLDGSAGDPQLQTLGGVGVVNATVEVGQYR